MVVGISEAGNCHYYTTHPHAHERAEPIDASSDSMHQMPPDADPDPGMGACRAQRNSQA